ncbi:MAG: hypothetical protein EOP87_00895 [Verrucomicrobiaceae bacterium]|nr:MAG: hypothetical protein EOP87_00895 [Verrucomicrobiaceae bacterium]
MPILGARRCTSTVAVQGSGSSGSSSSSGSSGGSASGSSSTSGITGGKVVMPSSVAVKLPPGS